METNQLNAVLRSTHCADCGKKLYGDDRVLMNPPRVEIELGISTVRLCCGRCAHKAIVR